MITYVIVRIKSPSKNLIENNFKLKITFALWQILTFQFQRLLHNLTGNAFKF